MKNFRSWATSALAGALLIACGGGDPEVPGSGSPSGAPTTRGGFTNVVSFGDSLSDLGTYTPATSISGDGTAPFLGGKWTTNTTPQSATLWVENIATGLGLLITPNEVGFAGQSVRCPAAGANPALATTCTGYGQAGARVTNPAGTGNASGALTVPLQTQIARHLETFVSFRASDLIFVWGGNNDALEQLYVFGAAATDILTRQALGQISADQASALLLNAQLAALAETKKAALELSAYVRDQILAKGGRYVAVVNLPDPASTPFGDSFAANPQTRGLAPVFSALAENFNLWLREGLKGQPVQIIDAWGLFKQIRANPGNFGLLNVTDPTCNFAIQDAVLGRVLESGRAMFCNVSEGAPFDMTDPRARADGLDKWLFADDFHPSAAGGHRVIAQEFTKQLRAFGWIN